MKFIVSITLAWLLTVGAGLGQGYVELVVNQPVPDADANGVALTGNVSGMSGTITALSVSLNVTNGYNGDLYAYLTGPNGGFAVLLNRAGVSNSASASGYGNSGLDVTFAAGGNDVHYYQSFGPVYNFGGQLTGSWAPDGRNVDPASAPLVFGSTAPSATLASFNGTSPNGTWTLYVADFSNGGVSTVNRWGLNVTTTAVPEPGSLTLLAGGAAVIACLVRRRGRKNCSRF